MQRLAGRPGLFLIWTLSITVLLSIAGCGGSSSATAPSAPPAVNAAAGAKQVTISWNPVSGATSYNIYWSTTSGVTPANGTKIASVSSPYTQTGLTVGTVYYYIVMAVNADGESAASSQVSAMPSDPIVLFYSFPVGTTGGNYPGSGLIMDGNGNFYGMTEEGGVNNDGTVFKLDTGGNVTVLHSFSGPDGATPYAGLIMDSNGTLYGTTESGGANNDGTVFKLDTAGNFTLLHSFSGSDGAAPYAGLIMDSNGNLYGTTSDGGAHYGGTVFEMDRGGNLTTLYNFSGLDGAGPAGGLIMDGIGNLYGTTSGGGVRGDGTVFKLDAGRNLTILHNFYGGTADGVGPRAGLVIDSNGNLYGTTVDGGASNFGIIFKIDTANNFTVVHSFSWYSDGADPYAGLIMDSNGNLYGTTLYGGASGAGTIFKLDSSSNLLVLHSFYGTTKDGSMPYAGLIMDGNGNLYGTTYEGGTYYDGTIFKLALN